MISQAEYEEFKKIIEKIINNESFKKMREIKQHRFSNCYDHSLNVATKCFVYAKKRGMKIDLPSLVRGSLLHDFYLYDWREDKKVHRWHTYVHPRIALENATREFNDLNEIEKDIILSHMWPMTFFRFPKYRESYLVCFCDKICAINELFKKIK